MEATFAILGFGLLIAVLLAWVGAEELGAAWAGGTVLLTIVVHFDWRLRQIRDRMRKPKQKTPSHIYCVKCEHANERSAYQCAKCGHDLD